MQPLEFMCQHGSIKKLIVVVIAWIPELLLLYRDYKTFVTFGTFSYVFLELMAFLYEEYQLTHQKKKDFDFELTTN